MTEVPATVVAATRAIMDKKMEMAADRDLKAARQEVMELTHKLQAATLKQTDIEAPYQKQIDEAVEFIRGNALEIGHSFESNGVKVKHTRGYTRATWSTQILDSLVKMDKELQDRIGVARRESEVAGRVSVEY